MKKTAAKTQIKIFLSVALCLLAGCALLTIVVDPFFQYHAPLDGVSYIIDNQLSQNAGIARNYTYDSVILGSSMTVNFDTLLFEELLDLNTVKLSCNAACPKDIDTMMGQVLKSDNTLKRVFLGIDIFTYKGEPGAEAYPIPSYLYDDQLWNDISYVLNKEVLVDYIVKPFVSGENTPLNEIYWAWPYMNYGEEYVLADYQWPDTVQDSLGRDFYQENIRGNMETYILPYIESMPDTVFTVFFPPYSILYWNDQYADGTWESELDGELQIVEMLLQYPNVEIYYFQNMFGFITDLDNYCDYTHYSKEMNDYMTECFGNGEHRITEDNYQAAIEEMREYIGENLRGTENTP